MKKYILITVALFLTSFAYTQSDKEEIDLMQAAFGKEKKVIVADFIQLSDTQKEPFWKLYDEYETKRKEIGKERIELLKQYAEQFMTMNSEQADEWTKKVIEVQKKTDNLIVTYYTKVKAVTDGVVATQFYQIEGYILTMMRMKLLQEVPFIKKTP